MKSYTVIIVYFNNLIYMIDTVDLFGLIKYIEPEQKFVQDIFSLLLLKFYHI